MIAEEDKHASSKVWNHWRNHCPISSSSPRTNPKWRTANIEKDNILMQCTHLTRRSHRTDKPAALRLFCITPPLEALVRVVKFDKMNSETEILFDTRPPQVTQGTHTYSSIGSEVPVRPHMESARGTPDAITHGHSLGEPGA